MQCHQPLFRIGYPTSGQCPPGYSFNVGSPDIIGEGEVTVVTFPDGTIQYYFVPVRWNGGDYYAKRWPPYPFCEPYCNSYTRLSGAWIITKISNMTSPVYNHCCQRINPEPFPKPFLNYDCNVNNASGFQLKFHNDCCTSTTDLQYFCPTVWKPIAVTTSCSAAVQVDTPIEKNCSCHIINKNVPSNYVDCACSNTKEFKTKTVQYKCKRTEKHPSNRMSTDGSKTSSSSCNIKKSKSKSNKKKKKNSSCSSCSSCNDSKSRTKKKRKIVCDCDFQNNAAADMSSSDQKQTEENGCKDVGGQRLPKKKKSQMDCSCDAQSIADKTVVTYTDQASSVKEVEGQTQTELCSNCSCSTLNVNRASVSKLWIPKRIRNLSLERILNVNETSSSASNRSSCSCLTSRESFK